VSCYRLHDPGTNQSEMLTPKDITANGTPVLFVFCRNIKFIGSQNVCDYDSFNKTVTLAILPSLKGNNAHDCNPVAFVPVS
jgi:hypothetical protein